MHDDDLGSVGNGGEARTYRVGSFRTTDHDRVDGGLGLVGVGVGDHEHDTVRHGASRVDRPVEDAAVTELFVLLGQVAAESAATARCDDDRPDRPAGVGVDRSACQLSASSSFFSASSSFTLIANVSSETRIWRALASMRFSPAERPLSFSRSERFRTTSATW